MILKKIEQLGYHYFHVFENKLGVRYEVKTTPEDYAQLGGKNPQNPMLDGYQWLFSYEDVMFDTPTGMLGDNEYGFVDARNVNGKLNPRYAIVKLVGKFPVSVDETDVVSDQLTPSGEAKVIKQNGH